MGQSCRQTLGVSYESKLPPVTSALDAMKVVDHNLSNQNTNNDDSIDIVPKVEENIGLKNSTSDNKNIIDNNSDENKNVVNNDKSDNNNIDNNGDNLQNNNNFVMKKFVDSDQNAINMIPAGFGSLSIDDSNM